MRAWREWAATFPLVMAGLVPAIPIAGARSCRWNRDRRAEPGDDGGDFVSLPNSWRRRSGEENSWRDVRGELQQFDGARVLQPVAPLRLPVAELALFRRRQDRAHP